MEIYTLTPSANDSHEPNVNWKRLYMIMFSAADKALTQIEHGKITEAYKILQDAVLLCEDEYIGDVGSHVVK